MKRSFMPLVLMLAAAVPASASAAVICVPATSAGCDDFRPDIAQAVAAAADGDTVRIAPGTYPESVATDKRLTFEGAGGGTLESGAGATVIASPAGPALTLSETATVRSLRAQGATFAPAVALQPVASDQAFSISDVVAFSVSGGLLGGPGVQLSPLNSGLTGLDVSVTGSELKGAFGTLVSSGGLAVSGPGATVTVERSRLEGPDGGPGPAMSSDGPDGTIVETTLDGSPGVALSNGSYAIERSRLESTTGDGFALHLLDFVPDGVDTEAFVSDSLLRSVSNGTAPNVVAVQVTSLNDSAYAELRNSTAIASGTDPMAAVNVEQFGAGTVAQVDLRNSVARLEGPAEAGEADLSAAAGTITAASSSFDTTAVMPVGTVPTPGADGNVVGAPLLDASFAPLPGSPLIDRGDPAFVLPGELDLLGLSRVEDGDGDCAGRPDIGAVELQREGPCGGGPPADPPAGPQPPANPAPENKPPALSRVSLLRKAFTARKPVRKGRKRGSAVRFTLSEAARVTLSLERRTSGRRVTVRGKRRCVARKRPNAGRPRCPRYVRAGALRMAGEAGRNALRIKGKVRGRVLAPGVYRAKLSAVDAGGLRSSVETLRFRVLRP